jgi:hypothetical protein
MPRSSLRVTTAVGTSACVHGTSRGLVEMGSVERFGGAVVTGSSVLVGGLTWFVDLELAQPAQRKRNVSAPRGREPGADWTAGAPIAPGCRGSQVGAAFCGDSYS